MLFFRSRFSGINFRKLYRIPLILEIFLVTLLICGAQSFFSFSINPKNFMLDTRLMIIFWYLRWYEMPLVLIFFPRGEENFIYLVLSKFIFASMYRAIFSNSYLIFQIDLHPHFPPQISLYHRQIISNYHAEDN